tara:strand:+ start:30845 stop:32143 length:1299 start_codon:yes stop_codon:yes gene_type:complete
MEYTNTVPHLKTLNIGTPSILEAKLIYHRAEIESWFKHEFMNQSILLTTSVDIRNAQYKLSPIDTNIFPAGFNNLSPELYLTAAGAFKHALKQFHQNCKRILIVPENHTRNPGYFESLAVLKNILMLAEFDVQVGSLLEIEKPLEVETSLGLLTLHPTFTDNRRLKINNFDPCMLLLNNDLSDGIPNILKNIRQPIMPSIHLGWTHRTKDLHAQHYEEIAQKFASHFSFDPWLIMPYFESCHNVDFMTRENESLLIDKATNVFENIQKKYQEHNINEKPFLVIKSSQGTYGMAVIAINNPEEIKQFNRKQRKKMSQSKGRQVVNQVLIQEGVYTKESINHTASAEPVVYMIGNQVIGGFYRFHAQKTSSEVLNTPGMEFQPLTFEDCCNLPNDRNQEHDWHDKFYVYSIIARLALLATCHESTALGENIDEA